MTAHVVVQKQASCHPAICTSELSTREGGEGSGEIARQAPPEAPFCKTFKYGTGIHTLAVVLPIAAGRIRVFWAQIGLSSTAWLLLHSPPQLGSPARPVAGSSMSSSKRKGIPRCAK